MAEKKQPKIQSFSTRKWVVLIGRFLYWLFFSNPP